MIIRSKLTKGEIESIKIGDSIELDVSNANNNNQVVKLIIKIEGFIQQKERCNGCTIILKQNDRDEFMGKIYCLDCGKKRRLEKSKMSMGHPRSKNAFGGLMNGNKVL